MSEINLEFLLGAMPAAEVTLYRVLIQLIPAPSAESTVAASRQIEMQVLAERTGFSKRWVIELLQRLEKKDFIRTEGKSGAGKWIRLLPLGVPLLGGPEANQSSQKEATSPAPNLGKAKAPRAAASRLKRRRKETAQSPKPGAEANVEPPVEKPAEMPKRRRIGPVPSAEPAVRNSVAPAIALIPPPPLAPTNPMLPAAMMPPPPPATPPGGPAPDNPVVTATTVTPAPSRARGGAAPSKPAVRVGKVAPPPSTAPDGPAASEPVVPAPMVPPVPSAAPGAPAPANPMRGARAALPSTAPAGLGAGIPMVRRAAKIAPPPAPGNPVVPAAMIPPASSGAPGIPAPGNPVAPAAMVTPEPAAPTAPAKRVSPRKSTKKLPAGQSHWESAPIEELVAYACSLSVTPELIYSLKTPGMTGGRLVLALERLCQRIERYGLMPYSDRSSLVTALRTILSDL